MQIYVVVGEYGEYSDRSEWAVVAYKDEAMAQQHVILADGEARKRELECKEINSEWAYDVYEKLDQVRNRPNPYDPQCGSSYSSYYETRYRIDVVTLNDALP